MRHGVPQLILTIALVAVVAAVATLANLALLSSTRDSSDPVGRLSPLWQRSAPGKWRSRC